MPSKNIYPQLIDPNDKSLQETTTTAPSAPSVPSAPSAPSAGCGESTNQDEPRRTNTNQDEPRTNQDEPRQTKNELTQTKPLGSELTLKQFILRKNTVCYTVCF